MTSLSKPQIKLLFVGVFENSFRSTNTSQLLSFKNAGAHVVGYNYRDKAARIGPAKRDEHLAAVIKDNNFDLVVYSKCNQVGFHVFEEINKLTATCLWFMDPLQTYNEEMRTKTALVDYFCCDKINVLEQAKLINKHSFLVPEGFDSRNDTPHEHVLKEQDVTFIGNVYGPRAQMLQSIDHPVNVVSNAFGKNHSIEVSKSKINLNFCTSEGASDRIYKVLAARGFLLSDDWHGRPEIFEDLKDLVIFKDVSDLNEKIEYYLSNPEETQAIAEHGHQTVQKYTRDAWAKRIIEINNEIR